MQKLQQIEKLKEQQLAGKQLELNQVINSFQTVQQQNQSQLAQETTQPGKNSFQNNYIKDSYNEHRKELKEDDE